MKIKTTGLTHDELAVKMYRAHQDCLCPVCGTEYWRHPYADEARDWDDVPYLNVLCDGDIVKL